MKELNKLGGEPNASLSAKYTHTQTLPMPCTSAGMYSNGAVEYSIFLLLPFKLQTFQRQLFLHSKKKNFQNHTVASRHRHGVETNVHSEAGALMKPAATNIINTEEFLTVCTKCYLNRLRPPTCRSSCKQASPQPGISEVSS